MNWKRMSLVAGMAAAIGLILPGLGGGALAKPKAGAHAPAPAAKAKPPRDDRDDDLEGVARHVVSIEDEGWLLVEDRYLKVGKSLRIRIAALIAPSDHLEFGVIDEADVEIDCMALKWRTLDRTVWSTTLSTHSFDSKTDEWAPLTRGAPLLDVADAFCNGRGLARGSVVVAPLDTLYSMAFDAPLARHLVAVTDDDADLVELRYPPEGQRPQAILTNILRRPDESGAFTSLTLEFNCERRTFRIHRTVLRDENASVTGTSGAEADWLPVEVKRVKVAAAAACEGVWPSEDRVLSASLGDLRGALLQGPWR